jgi:hypothetical protein
MVVVTGLWEPAAARSGSTAVGARPDQAALAPAANVTRV